MACFVQVVGVDLIHLTMEHRSPFDHQLRHVIMRYRLETLFSNDGGRGVMVASSPDGAASQKAI
jgi:hypothetical protein